MTDTKPTTTQMLGTLICRVIVPAWVGLGMVFKAREFAPGTLPQWIIDMFRGLSEMFETVSLNDFLLWFLIGLLSVEAIAFLLMVASAKLARATAIFMMLSFCIVLVVQMVTHGFGACGCFGGTSPDVSVMFGIDFTLLLGAILFKPTPRTSAALPLAMVGLLALALVAALATKSVPEPDEGDDVSAGGNGQTQALDGGRRPLVQPPQWYWPEIEKWVGKRWDELDIATHMRRWPENWDQGTHIVMFYRMDCDHCHELLTWYFVGDLPQPTTLIAVPEGGRFPANPLENPCTQCDEIRLSTQVEWYFQTPTVVRLEDGVVACANIEENPEMPECVPW